MPTPIGDIPAEVIGRIASIAHPANRQALRLTSLRHAIQDDVCPIEHVVAMLRHVLRYKRLALRVTCKAIVGPHLHVLDYYTQPKRARFEFLPRLNPSQRGKFRVFKNDALISSSLSIVEAIDLLAEQTCDPIVARFIINWEIPETTADPAMLFTRHFPPFGF